MPTEYISYFSIDLAIEQMRRASSSDEYHPILVEQIVARDGSNATFEVTSIAFSARPPHFVGQYGRGNSFMVSLYTIGNETQVSIARGKIFWGFPLSLDPILNSPSDEFSTQMINRMITLILTGFFLIMALALLLTGRPAIGIIVALVIFAGWINTVHKTAVTPWVKEWVRKRLPPSSTTIQ